MSTLAPKQLMTAVEFFDWVHRPENRDRRFELERGEVVELSRPGERHGAVCIIIGHLLMTYAFRRRKGYALSNDTGIILEQHPDTVRGPDVMFFDELRRFHELNPKWSDRPPVLVVEVLLPNDQWGKVTRRIAQYLGRGVPLVWLVDPEGLSVTVYRSGQLPQVFEGTDELTGGDVLPDFRCRVAEFFALPGEETPA